jgi:hypothetical protein
MFDEQEYLNIVEIRIALTMRFPRQVVNNLLQSIQLTYDKYIKDIKSLMISTIQCDYFVQDNSLDRPNIGGWNVLYQATCLQCGCVFMNTQSLLVARMLNCICDECNQDAYGERCHHFGEQDCDCYDD